MDAAPAERFNVSDIGEVQLILVVLLLSSLLLGRDKMGLSVPSGSESGSSKAGGVMFMSLGEMCEFVMS